MREIEFRGYSTEHKKWIYGYLTCDIPMIYNPKYGTYDVDKKSVGQYTGLKDKNGKKIFEGDILVDSFYKDKKDCFYTKVEYNCWNCGCCSNVFGYDIDIDPIFEEGIKTNKVDGYIVGNIYENPELLKENKKC